MKAGNWVKLIAISVGAVFILLTYVHGSFVTQVRMETHSDRPHKTAVTKEQYNIDMLYLRTEITNINNKLDRALRR